MQDETKPLEFQNCDKLIEPALDACMYQLVQIMVYEF